jgi:cytochrome c oxidase assembly protein subunit 15
MDLHEREPRIHPVDARLYGRDRQLATGAAFVAAALLAQAAIGIMTLIQRVPIELALLHHAVALVVLAAATLHAARTFGSTTPEKVVEKASDSSAP